MGNWSHNECTLVINNIVLIQKVEEEKIGKLRTDVETIFRST